MPTAVHPSALVGPEVALGANVAVGPYVVIEGPVTVGDGTVIRPFAHLIGPLTLGPGNDIGTGAVIGDRPQHGGYKGEPTSTVIGTGNVFREHVTVHRGTTFGDGVTRVGDRNTLMAGAHVAHDCTIGDDVILANGALVGGHAVVGDRAFLSGNSCVHQWCRVGRYALISGNTPISVDLPPFCMVQIVNRLVGINLVGMRRAGYAASDVKAVRRAYTILWREGRTMAEALARAEAELAGSAPVAEMLAFIRASKRGVVSEYAVGGGQGGDSAAAAA